MGNGPLDDNIESAECPSIVRPGAEAPGRNQNKARADVTSAAFCDTGGLVCLCGNCYDVYRERVTCITVTRRL